jgi:peroxisome-assembly ATPase
LLDDLKLSDKTAGSVLFNGEEEVFAFRRALSRMQEIQTDEYWGKSGPARLSE